MAVSRKPAAKAESEKVESGSGEPVAYLSAIGRNADGTPNVSGPFKLLLTEGASDDDKRAAWNHPDGELPPASAIHYVPKPHV